MSEPISSVVKLGLLRVGSLWTSNMHIQVHAKCALWLAKSSWPEMQIVENNSMYLINSNSDISRIEGLGVYGEIQQQSSQSKADFRQQRSAGQGAVGNRAVVGGGGALWS